MSKIIQPNKPPISPCQKQLKTMQLEAAALMRRTMRILHWCSQNLTEDQLAELKKAAEDETPPPSPIIKPH